MRHPAHTIPTPCLHSDMTPTLHGVHTLGPYQDLYRYQDRRPETGANSRAVLLSSTRQGLWKKNGHQGQCLPFMSKATGWGLSHLCGCHFLDRWWPMTMALTQEILARARR